jgi:Asp-tRNA(Asn)/Glu-tRNA(Gln) amidotransferase A subunit family amidase
MANTEFWRLSAAQLLEGYARHDFSPVEVVRELFDRVDQLNPALSAFLVMNTDDALAAAQTAENVWMGPGEKPALCGVPVSIKDSIEVGGMPTTYGSLAFKDNRQPDGELVRRIRAAGGVITGKTNLPEFALHGAVDNLLSPVGRNPWNLDHTCGGSSGGAGNSVATGMGPIGIGTDSGGSIRMPAAANGVYGIKPTYQRIPAVQTWRAAPGRSHNGPLTRTVRDAALLMQAISGADPRDGESNVPPVDFMSFADGDVRGLRVVVSYDFGRGFAMDAEALKFVREAAQLLAELGCEIIEADPPTLNEPEELEPGVWAYAGDHFAAAEAMIPGFLEKHIDDLGAHARPLYEKGPEAKAWQYRRIVRRNRGFGLQMQEWFRDYDFLLSPSIGPAAKLADIGPRDRSRALVSFTSPFNHTYNPAAAIPFGFHSTGLPLGVQIVGRLRDDVGVLRMSAAFEKANPWAHRWPAMAEDTALAKV